MHMKTTKKNLSKKKNLIVFDKIISQIYIELINFNKF